MRKKFWPKKIILGVLERLENSKNTRKIDGIELQSQKNIFEGSRFGSRLSPKISRGVVDNF